MSRRLVIGLTLDREGPGGYAAKPWYALRENCCAAVAVNAVAPDGVIEGIEAQDYRFSLGVQWHPEYAISAADPAIFDAFLAAAGQRS